MNLTQFVPDGEKALADAAASKKTGATIVVVSHRPALLRSTDILAVLNQGSLVKVGPTDQVLAELGATNVVSGQGSTQQMPKYL